MKNLPELKQSYEESIKEIEKILENFEAPTLALDDISKDLARATDLIKGCREQLRITEEDINRIIIDQQE